MVRRPEKSAIGTPRQSNSSGAATESVTGEDRMTPSTWVWSINPPISASRLGEAASLG